MAEGILRDIANKKNLDIEVSSAGVSVYDGDVPNKKSVDAMDKIGIDIRGHRSTQLHRQLVEETDVILTMSIDHKENILSDFPSSVGKVFTVIEYAYGLEKDVVDPYGRSLEFYEKTRDEIYQAIVQFKIVNKNN